MSDICLPVDDRASKTLDILIEPLVSALNKSTNLKDATMAINDKLPRGISHNTELRMRFKRNLSNSTIEQIKLTAIESVKNVIGYDLTRNSPILYDENGNKSTFFSRGDVVRWCNERPWANETFKIPETELITIEIYSEPVQSLTLELTDDQLIGIAYGLNAIKDKRVRLVSSITNNIVNVNYIVKYSLDYKQKLDLATERLKRPYQIEIKQEDGTYQTVNFVNPQFLQGLISVAKWFNMKNNGKYQIWRNLTQFTKSGEVALKFE